MHALGEATIGGQVYRALNTNDPLHNNTKLMQSSLIAIKQYFCLPSPIKGVPTNKVSSKLAKLRTLTIISRVRSSSEFITVNLIRFDRAWLSRSSATRCCC